MTHSPPRDLTEHQARLALIVLVVAATLVFTALASLRLAAGNCYGRDAAEIGNAFHRTVEGRLFPTFDSNTCLLGSHVDLYWFLWLPFFWVIRSIYGILFFQSLMICLAAWPAYRLAHRLTGDRITALLGAATLLLLPAVARVHVVEIHDDGLGFAALIFAGYFYYEKRIAPFTACLVASLLAKETIILNVVFFALLALLHRRNWRWVVFPGLWSVGYFLFVKNLVMPQLGDWWSNQLYSHGSYFDQWGKSAGEIVHNMLAHPQAVLKTMLAADRVRYLVWSLLPFLMVGPFGNWGWVVVVPAVVVNLLSTNDCLRSPDHWYNILIAGQLWCSFIASLSRWTRWLPARFGERNYTRLLCLLLLIVCVAQSGTWLHRADYRYSTISATRHEALAHVPANASVLCGDNLLPLVVAHPSFTSINSILFCQQDVNQIFDYQYLVFDENYHGPIYVVDIPTQLLGYIVHHPAYRPVFSRDGIHVFERIGEPTRNLKWHVEPAPPHSYNPS